MATIFRKTDKGQSEIETRLYRLAPRLRTALILVDGRRTDAELAKLIPGDPEASLRQLLGEGFIEVQSTVEARTTPRAGSSSSNETGSRTTAGSGFGNSLGSGFGSGFGAGDTGSAPEFRLHRRNAIKAFTDQVGPMAEALAIRMEKCGDWSHLLPVLQLAQQVIRNTRGSGAANEFGANYIDTPPP
jgi:hypothetical protein